MRRSKRDRIVGWLEIIVSAILLTVISWLIVSIE